MRGLGTVNSLLPAVFALAVAGWPPLVSSCPLPRHPPHLTGSEPSPRPCCLEGLPQVTPLHALGRAGGCEPSPFTASS